MNIGMFTECDRDYARLLTLQDTLPKLRKFTKSYERVATDAAGIAACMSQEDFKTWRRGLEIERRGQFAGIEFMKEFGDLLMPRLLFKVSMVATKFGVPWGLAFKRMQDIGQIVEDEYGIARLVENKS